MMGFGAMLLLLAVPQGTGLPSESYGLVLRRDRDTASVERVERGAHGMRAEVTVPNRARLLVTAQTDASRCVQSAEVQVFPWAAADGSTPVQHVTVRLGGDSLHVTASVRGMQRSLSRPAPGVRAVLAEESVAASALLVECARSLRTPQSDSVAIPVVAFPNLRMRSVVVRWQADSVMLVGADTSWAFTDREGHVSRLRLERGQLDVRRVSTAETERIVRAMQVTSDYAAPVGAPYHATDVQVAAAPGVVLAGTLTMPSGRRGKLPVIVTISGSGGQNRDSYAPIADGWRPFRQLADSLARRGVATLRLDDRGIGGSTGDYASSTELTTAADTRAAIAYLRMHPEIDGSRVVVLGHSEGVRVAMLVAAEDSSLAAMALLSGAADTREAMRAQTLWAAERRLPKGVSRDSLLAAVNRGMDSVAARLPREVLRWNASEQARRIRMPVGIFHGATDRQVPVAQADSLAAVFRRAGNRDVTVRILADRNHLLLYDSDGDFFRYDQLTSARLDSPTLGAIVDWIVTKVAPATASR